MASVLCAVFTQRGSDSLLCELAQRCLFVVHFALLLMLYLVTSLPSAALLALFRGTCCLISRLDLLAKSSIGSGRKVFVDILPRTGRILIFSALEAESWHRRGATCAGSRKSKPVGYPFRDSI